MDIKQSVRNQNLVLNSKTGHFDSSTNILNLSESSPFSIPSCQDIHQRTLKRTAKQKSKDVSAHGDTNQILIENNWKQITATSNKIGDILQNTSPFISTDLNNSMMNFNSSQARISQTALMQVPPIVTRLERIRHKAPAYSKQRLKNM